jgi:hypothetical protein
VRICTRNSSEGPPTTITQSGVALVPRRVFCCLVNALRYCRGITVEFEFAAGTITLPGRTQIRQHQISVNDGIVEALTSVELEYGQSRAPMVGEVSAQRS